MTGVPGVLLDACRPAIRRMLGLRRRPTAAATAGRGRRRRAPRRGRPGARDGGVAQRVELLGAVVGGRAPLPVRVGVPVDGVPGRAGVAPGQLQREVQSSSTSARCLSSPPRVIVEAAVVARRPAASRPPHFQRERAALALQRAEQGLDLGAGDRRLEDRGVVVDRSWRHARVGSGRSASGLRGCVDEDPTRAPPHGRCWPSSWSRAAPASPRTGSPTSSASRSGPPGGTSASCARPASRSSPSAGRTAATASAAACGCRR